MDFLGIKELYDIAIKATQPIKFCGRVYEPGENLVFLERAQLALLNENSSRVFARGGKENRRLIMWKSEQPIQFQIQQGVISKEYLSILTNNNLIEEETYSIGFRDRLAPELPDKNNEIRIPLKHKPEDYVRLFVYSGDGNKIPKEDTQRESDDSAIWIVHNDEEKQYDKINEFIVDGYFTKTGKVLNIGKDALHGYLRLEAKTRVKDDTEGYEKTGIIIIPKMRIMSDLSIRLGDSITPMVYGFTIEGEPVGPYGEAKVCDLFFLNEDIDSESL